MAHRRRTAPSAASAVTKNMIAGGNGTRVRVSDVPMGPVHAAPSNEQTNGNADDSTVDTVVLVPMVASTTNDTLPSGPPE